MIRNLWWATGGALLRHGIAGLIRGYQLTLSPMIGPVCRYYPSCSHYGREAVLVHGAGKGVILTAWRVLRCNPWSRGGVDLVPPRGSWTESPTHEYKVIEVSTTDRQVVAQ